MLLLSFVAVVAIARVLEPIDAKFFLHKALVLGSGAATLLLLLSLVLAFTTSLSPASLRVSVSRFAAGTVFALLVLGLLLHDFVSSPASSTAPSTVSTAVATPVAGQASTGAKL
jgi:hypothetical protein